MASVTDFVIVRFATRPFSFMRIGHVSIVAWLELKKIPYTVKGKRAYFELPEDLHKYTIIDDRVREEMRPLATEVKRRLSAISWSTMRRYRKSLTYEELQNLAEIGVAISL